MSTVETAGGAPTMAPDAETSARDKPGLLLFAYDSTLAREAILRLCPSAIAAAVAELPEHRLCFPRWDERERSHVAGITAALRESVWGVVWRIAQDEIAALDAHYGVAGDRPGYQCLAVPVHDQAKAALVGVRAYVPLLDKSGKPSDAYLGKIVAGAQESGLPAAYVDDLRAIARGKKIILLSDGTGNSERSPFKTNVWRIYQALRLAPGEQIARYDDGVGTSTVRPLALLGGAVGWGLKRNVIDLYKFVCRNYARHDELYGFGFSRGAFTIRVLVGLLETQGIVAYHREDGSVLSEQDLTRRAAAAYRAYRDEHFDAPLARLGRIVRDAWIWLRNQMLSIPPYKKAENIPLPSLRFLGLWDSVDAYGMPIRELKSAVDRYIWPLTFRNLELSDKVECARHALALDDERATFHPLIWDELQEQRKERAGLIYPERIKQVWFAGAHANVGGGYPDDGLAHVPLLWILDEARATGLDFEEELVRIYRATANPFGKLYDSRSGFASYYRYSPRRVDRLPDPPYTGCALIHQSVYARIQHGLYAPISIHGLSQCLPTRADAAPCFNVGAMDLVLDTVWWRRIAYWTSVLVSMLLVGFPWLAGFFTTPEEHRLSEVVSGSPILQLVKMFTPSVGGIWIDAWAKFPLTSSTLFFLVVVAFAWGLHLRDRVGDRARAAWRIDPNRQIDRSDWIRETTRRQTDLWRGIVAAAILTFGQQLYRTGQGLTVAILFVVMVAPVLVTPIWLDRWWVRRGFDPAGAALQIARFLRTDRTARRAERYLVKRAIPFLFLLAIAAAAFYSVNSLGFAVLSAAGEVCRPTEGKLVALAPGSTERRSFDIADPCFATGIRLTAGAKYRITFASTTDWHDASIDLAKIPRRGAAANAAPARITEGYSSFAATVPPWLVLAAPMRRFTMENWFKPIARLGQYGNEQYVLGPNATLIEPQHSGELFLYVNDAVLGFPWVWDAFYSNNVGTAEIEISGIEPPQSY